MRVYSAFRNKPHTLREQKFFLGRMCMDNKTKKILAIVISAVISIIVAVAATLLGVRPDEIVDVLPDTGIADLSGAVLLL